MCAKKLNQYEKGFLEGLIDGEGCLSSYRNKEDLVIHRISISNNCIELLEKAKKIIGDGFYVTKKARGNYCESYELRLGPRVLRWLLPQLVFCTPSKERRRVALLWILKRITNGENRFTQDKRKKIIKEYFGTHYS